MAGGVGLTVGGLTSVGQRWLPDDLGSLANAAGPWSLAAFVVAFLVGPLRLRPIIGAVLLIACELGYVVVNELRGIPNGTSTIVFWILAGALAGPLLGAAAALARTAPPWLAGTGVGVLAGVLAGEGIYGLTVVADTTAPGYWIGELALAGALAVAVVWWRRSTVAGVAAVVVAALSGLVVNVVARVA